MSSLDEWKAKNIFEVTLKSGVHVKGKYVAMARILLVPAIASGADLNGDASSAESMVRGITITREIVKQCLLEVEGEPVSLTDDDLDMLDEADLSEFQKYANREIKVPKAKASS